MIKIDPEFKALIPPLAPDELRQLEENILRDGCRDPLVVWVVPPDESWWTEAGEIQFTDTELTDEEIESDDKFRYGFETIVLHRVGRLVYVKTRNRSEGELGDWSEEWRPGVEILNSEPSLEGCVDGRTILIDGHNRYEICTRNNIPFETLPMAFESAAHARIWMRKNQAGRRNLSDGWKIELEFGNKKDLLAIGKVKREETVGRPSKEKLLSQNDTDLSKPKHSTRVEIAKAAGVSTGQVGMAEQIKKKAPALWEKAKQGQVSISGAYKEIKKEEKKQERMASIESQKAAIKSGAATLPVGVFEVVAIDPPWNYGREYDPDTSRVANPYPEMTQAELLALNPPFAEDCCVFLWTTQAFIWDAKALMDSWGFTYKATIVWDKERLGMGAWLRMQCEFCLVGIKGKPAWNNTKWRDIIRESRREHSRKPEAFYEMVEDITIGRRLDFFSREARNGWEAFGNDTGKF